MALPKDLPLVIPVNGPYTCPVCSDQRGYKFESSLRKHIRLHHPGYKRNTVAHVAQVPSTRENITATTRPVLNLQQRVGPSFSISSNRLLSLEILFVVT